ncbi:YDG domain-containing protein [Rhodoplanes sp. Z2-YC6860]|uniref:YDG domain-containing protein n=1 Tax=Rhodoplanes sp. Z2-YC6860 TaxID=674703 RepID=UPI00078E991B|nr:YDG domain-containing protein [Rhodoplanes sp. Z2-YC6860]AMN41472.1 filamentous hemagglutinin outer membrane protein [Rhodoplanes sp. Z2-YC6860]
MQFDKRQRRAVRRPTRDISGKRDPGAFACALLLAYGTTAPAFADPVLPNGGSVAAGSATITQPNSSTLNVNQSTSQAIVNWQSFSLGQGTTVNFNQPSSASATLNRVLGSTPSTIAGTINAPGTVLLVNPNGIAITKDGVVNVGSFAASTLDIKNEDFLSGRYKFTGNGGSAAVTNAGRINVSDGGFAALLGGQVANSGVISARLGKVGLGAGELITLDLAGDGFLSVAVPSSQLGNLVDANGALVTNSGTIRASGGQVFLSAATAANILRDAVNVPGTIRANSVGTRGGKIVINGGLGGKVNVTGRLAANGSRKHGTNGGSIAVTGAAVSVTGKVTANGKNGGAISVAATNDLAVSGSVAAAGRDGVGGRIDLTGADVKVLGALIDASGTTGGGLVRIGGTFQGGNGEPSSVFYQSAVGRFGVLPDLALAQTVSIDAGTTINVSAKTSGDGGSAIVWSQQTTSFTGTVLGSGGANGGNGGFVEVSGKEHLALGGSFDLRAAHGSFGTLLADPGSINIQSGGNTYNGTDTFNDGYLNALLAGANVVLDTNNASGANGTTGDITLMSGASLSWNAATTLTLNAAHDIIFQNNASITAGSGGSVVLNADSAGSGSGTVTFQGTGTQVTVSGGGSVSAYYNPAVFNTPDFDTTKVSGPLTAYMLVNTADDFLSITNQVFKYYALAKDLDLGQIGARGTFNSTFDGRMHTITYSSVGSASNPNPSLFATIGEPGTIRNLGVNFTVSETAAINHVGGIAGTNNGVIENSFAIANVLYLPMPPAGSGIDTAYVGGLVGENGANGTINNSSASGIIWGGLAAGGLVGLNSGVITNSSASTTIRTNSLSVSPFSGSIQVYSGIGGGLVGVNASGAVILNSFATGDVTFSSSSGGAMGGLVGINGGSIYNSFATGSVSANGDAGGLVGQNSGNISGSFATGNAASSGTLGYWFREHLDTGPRTAAGGLVGWNNGHINGSYSLGTGASGSGVAGGALIGTNGPSGVVQTSYWNTDVQAVGNGYTYVRVVGRVVTNDGYFDGYGVQTTDVNGTQTINGSSVSSYAFNQSAYVGFGFSNDWYMVNGFTRPIPRGFGTSDIGNSSATTGRNAAPGLIAAMELELIGANLGGSYRLISDIDLSSSTSSPLWSSKGFGPIGGYTTSGNATNPDFTGTLDGQGYAISNLNIVASTETGTANGNNGVGLFQSIGATGTVTNLGLESGSITGNQAVAALAVNNSGTISNVYSKLDVLGFNNVAGLVFNNQGVISSAYTSGSVDTTLNSGINNGSTVGGIVGLNYGSITNAYSTGAIIGATGSGARTGGIAGFNAGTIQNVYVTGAVTGGGDVGAIAGQNFAILLDSNFNSVPTNGQITNAYWNTDTVGVGTSTGDGLGLVTNSHGMDTATMQDLANRATNFVGFDFNNVWAPPGNGYYPELYTTSRVVWVDANDASRTYGDANPALTANLHGLHGSDQILLAGFNLTSGATVTSNVGGYAITDGGATLTGADGKTYRFIDTGTLTVTQRQLSGTATITGIDKTYDGNADAAGGSVALTAGNNVVNGDVVTLSATSGTYTDKNVVGVETVTINGASLNNSNYTLGSLTYGGTGQITAKTLTVGLTGTVRKTYDATTDATVAQANYTSLSGIVGTDAVLLDTANAVGSYDNANAGSGKNVTVTGLQLTGAQAGNYTIASATGRVGQIDQRALSGTVLITGIDKTYDKTAAASGGSANLTGANGVLGNDTVSVSVVSGTYAGVNAGLQGVTVSTFSVGNSNYSVGSLAPTGSGTISPRAITVTAATDSRTYNGYTDSSGTPTVTSATQIVAGDSGNFSQVFASKNVLGTNGSTLQASGSVNDGNNGNNYTVTFVDAQGTITPTTLSITAVANTKAYDATTSAAGVPTVSGLKGNTDTVTGLSEIYVDPNVGTGKTINVATYTVNDGNNGANYTVQTFASFSGAITKAVLTYVAAPTSRLIGAANPPLTGQVTGFFGADTLSSATTGILQFNSLANSSSPAGSYAIDGSGLSAANYVFVQAAGNATALTVMQPTSNPASQFRPLLPTLSGPEMTIPSPPPPDNIGPISFTPSKKGANAP